jgi:imidazolonepropionase-like amidohydrolase
VHWVVATIAALIAAGCAGRAPPPDSPRPTSPARSDAWVLSGTRIYPAPDAAPIDDGTVLIEGGRIAMVAPTAAIQLPAGLPTSPCSGGVIVAGFQNSHVHFTQPEFQGAITAPAKPVSEQLESMLGRYGVTTAVEIASGDVRNTIALRDRIERGEVRGPRVITVGMALYPPEGIPFYLADLPAEIRARLPQPADPESARAIVRGNFEQGAQGTKLFIATPVTFQRIERMPPEIAKAAVAETHARGGFVFAHPTDIDGVRAAVAAGVDALSHTTIDPPKAVWDEALIRDMVARNVAVTPTLKLWPYELAKTKLPEKIRELALGDAIASLRAFAAAGGQVLFGTDVGYMTEYDPTDEYVYMARAGLTPMQILASLTTAPATRWKEEARRGQVAPGMDADLVVLEADPASDVRNFARVKCTFRGGRALYTDPALNDPATSGTPPP